MNEEILEGIIETQKMQRNTIDELFDTCVLLKDRIEALEHRLENSILMGAD